MKWEIDFNELNDVVYELEDYSDFLLEFIENYEKLINSITMMNNGKFFEEIYSRVDEELPDLKNLQNQSHDLMTATKKYINDLDIADEWTGTGIYKVNTNVAYKYVNKIKSLINSDFKNISSNHLNFEEKIETMINKFRITESNINIESDYADQPDMINFIQRRQNEINNDINDFKHNCEIIEKTRYVINKLERELDDLI